MAAFTRTPSNNTPNANGYYDGQLAQTRARAHYEYDPSGRLYWIAHYWDTLSNGAYTSEAILAQGCDYELNTGLNRGLKLDSKYYTRTSSGQPNWTLSQTDTYSYDPALDCLTGATYGDGQANASPSWSYDAAGNRNDTVADNLNRPTSIGGVAITSDILGNRLTMGSNSYGWDALNRLTSYNSTSYVYRADGMRVSKSNSSGSTSYRYDGQMGMEDVDFAANGSVSKVTDYGIGARGIDGMYVTQNGTTTMSYPIYDAHGNMISTLWTQGTGSYAFSSLRTFDAWGSIRRGALTGDPKGRYCANLGHKEDDESGLIYMRARSFEPSTGRFVNEDSKRSGSNWFSYASDNPVRNVDKSGQDTLVDVEAGMSISDYIESLVENLQLYCKDLVSDLANGSREIGNGSFRSFLDGIGEDPEKWRYGIIKVGNEQGLSGAIKILYSDQMEEAGLIKSIFSEAGEVCSHPLPSICLNPW